jgi:shikimate kinase/3-dehydroquinate synthase
MVGALGRHLALAGFMGAGKTTVGRRVAEIASRPFVDLDGLIERRHGPIPTLFERGEPEFRRLEEEELAGVLAGPDSVVALGGGAVLSPLNRERLRARAFTVYVDVAVETAWERVRGSNRPLAQREDDFRRLYESRQAAYSEAADAVATGAEDVLLASLGVRFGGVGAPPGPAEVIADANVLDLHPSPVDVPIHRLPPGEEAKSLAVVETLWRELSLGRDGTIVAFGGGSTTDVAGFVAATYLRGVEWIAVPTTLTGQVDAAIGGKTAIDIPEGKNLVGAFHWPERVVIDPALLETLPERELRQGRSELIKTSLLAGRDLDVRGAAAYKTAVCLRDPRELGPRALLNLGHTFAHALEAASGYELAHGDAVALGLLAALRLSGNAAALRTVEAELAPQQVRVDRGVAWDALLRDKKRAAGRIRLVLLPRNGEPEWGVELPEDDVRRELDRLIAG